jgi:hypothetical protein
MATKDGTLTDWRVFVFSETLASINEHITCHSKIVLLNDNTLVRTFYAFFSLYSIYTATIDKNPQLLARSSQLAAPSARPKPPRSGTPILRRATPLLPLRPLHSSRCASSRAASRCCCRRRSPSTPLSTLAPPRRSTSARNIMRFGRARPGAGFSGCTSRSLRSSDVASICFKCFTCFRGISVSYGCCKNRLGYCIYYNDCTRLLQTSTPNVLSVFSDVCCKFVYLDVVYVSHIYCKCFILMLRIFCNDFQVFLAVFASVSDTYFRCFICLQTYVASVASGCFKSRFNVAQVATCCSCWRVRGAVRGHKRHAGLSRGADAAWGQVGRRRRMASGGTRSADGANEVVAGVRTGASIWKLGC